MAQGKIPVWAMALPLIFGGSYFYYSYSRKKEPLHISLTMSLMLAMLASIPYVVYALKSNTAPALGATTASNTASDSGNIAAVSANTDTPMTGDLTAHLNAMDKHGRRKAIDFIVSVEETTKSDGSPKHAMRKAFSTLTNDELKVLYCQYQFLVNQITNLDSDAAFQNTALNQLGIDLSGLSNISKIEDLAITKYHNALNTMGAEQ